MIDEQLSYLTVAESRQLFALVTPYLLTKCTQEVYTVCPSDMMLKTAVEPDCLIALFLGKMDIVLSKCKRLVINGTFEPVWIRSPDASYWIYSLSTPQRVTVQCHGTGSPLSSTTSSQVLLEGTGILSNSSSYADNFKLLPHSLGKTTTTLNNTHIVLPRIERILQFSEEAVLQLEPTPIHLQRLDEISARTASRSQMRGAAVTRIINIFQDAAPDRHPMSWMWFVGIVILSFIIGSMWPIWFRVIKCGYSYIRKHVPTPAKSLKPLTTQKTNASGTKLQEVQLSSEVAFTEEVQEITSFQLTAFVQHGVVTVAE